MCLYPSVSITSPRCDATNCRHACLSASAWFCSASASVVAAVSTSTVSQSFASHIARRRVRSNRSAATSRCCVIATSSSPAVSAAEEAFAFPKDKEDAAPPAPPEPGPAPPRLAKARRRATPSSDCLPVSSASPRLAENSCEVFRPVPSGSSSEYRNCRSARNTGARTSPMRMIPSLPSRISAPVRSMARNAEDRAATTSECAGKRSPSTSNTTSVLSASSVSSVRIWSPSVGNAPTSMAGASCFGRFSAPPEVTTSSISYRNTIVSSLRYPLLGDSSTLRRTNLR